MWRQTSARSDKFDSTATGERRDQRKWRGFARYRGRAVTMRTVIGWVSADRQAQMIYDIPDLELEALIGTPSHEATSSSVDWADFDVAEGEAALPKWFTDLNARHALVCIGGKSLALTERVGGSVDLGPVEALDHLYANRRVQTKAGSEPISKAWMRHPARRTYENGIAFAPDGAPEGTYNLWRGFGVKPDPSADCSLFLQHLQGIICGGDPTCFDWLTKWFAHMIQRPWEKPGTAVVLRGSKGAGKDTVADYLKLIFPTHVAEIKQPDQLTGRFNGHLDRALLAHVEEGFWAGDKGAESTLKALITSERLLIERKGVDIVNVDSCLRIFISSNERWVVPSSFDERRFFVLNVSSARAQDSSYFGAIRREQDNRGPAALLHYLQSLDLTGFYVRDPPMTEGLRDQKLASLKGFDRWLFEVLGTGDAPSGSGDIPAFADDWSAGPVSVGKSSVREHYRRWMSEHRFQGEPVGEADFTKRLRVYVPELEERRPRENNRARTYIIPAVSSCRETFQRFIGQPIDWA